MNILQWMCITSEVIFISIIMVPQLSINKIEFVHKWMILYAYFHMLGIRRIVTLHCLLNYYNILKQIKANLTNPTKVSMHS